MGAVSLASMSIALPALADFEPFVGEWRCTAITQGGEAITTAGRFSFTAEGRYEWSFDEEIPHLSLTDKGRWTFNPVDSDLRLKSNNLLKGLLAPPGFKDIAASVLLGETLGYATLSIASIYGVQFYSPLNLRLERET
jgi:hypothetical protein